MHEEAMAGMAHEPGGMKLPPKRVKTMVTTFHPNKVHITHHHTHQAHPPETHEYPIHHGTGLDALHDHIEDHVGQPNDGEEAAEAGGM